MIVVTSKRYAMKPTVLLIGLVFLAACGKPSNDKRTLGEKLGFKKQEEPLDLNDPETMRKLAMELKKDSLEQRREASEALPAEDPVKKEETLKDGAEVHYFTGTKKVAVKITPWKDRKRFVICYDRKGNETYRFEDMLLSHSEITVVRSYHPNGAANEIEQHSNPGGSRYLPKTTYFFDEENYPVRSEYDSDRDEDQLNPPPGFTKQWDRATRSWL